MNGCKCQQEFPGASGAHTELKTAYEPVPLLLWEQPGQNKRAIVFFWQPSYRNAIYHRPYSLLQKSQDSYFATQLVRTVGRILNKVWAQALPRRSTVQLQGTRHYPFSFLHWGFLSFLQVPSLHNTTVDRQLRERVFSFRAAFISLDQDEPLSIKKRKDDILGHKIKLAA